MGASSFRPLDRLRRPEYTGENRCMPCTTVNVILALALAVAIALVVTPIAAAAVLALSLAAIYFRGYLVPGTPTLTQRYFPEWLLAAFDKEPTGSDAKGGAAIEATATDGDAAPPESVDPEKWLLDHEVLVPCEDVDDLCLPDDLRETFHDRFDRFRDGDRSRQLASFLEVEADGLTVADDAPYDVTRDGEILARWWSEGRLVVDLAAASVLEERVPAWQRLSPGQRSEVAGGLRTFADRCPLCGEPIALDEELERRCCGRRKRVYTVGCEKCDETLLEYEQSVEG